MGIDQDTVERPVREQHEPTIELTVTELPRRAPAESPFGRAARNLVTPGDHEFFEWQGAILVTAETPGAKEAAAREIWTRAAAIVAQSVTLDNQRRALREGLLTLVGNDFRPELGTQSESASRRQLTAWFMGVFTEILKALPKDVVVELLLPGSAVFVPSSSFIDAIVTACDLLTFPEAA